MVPRVQQIEVRRVALILCFVLSDLNIGSRRKSVNIELKDFGQDVEDIHQSTSCVWSNIVLKGELVVQNQILDF
jgi:hypothetical protein